MLAIAREPIDVAAVEAAVGAPEFGAVVTFVGRVRQRADDGQSVDGLTYEAHEPLAVETFERIVREQREQHGALEIAIVHREGVLDVGEVAVVVSVAAPHRREAFAACAAAIEALKQQAPIWKKERYADGSARWRENSR